jgi:dihydrofolate reductase
MATYTVDLFMTLDGNGSGAVPFWGKEGPELLAQRQGALDRTDRILVMGANTYRLMERFAPATNDPGFAAPPTPRKIVISRTLSEPLTLPNTSLISGDAVEVVPRLKAESDLPLYSHGSITMNRALLAAGLVDRLEVMIFPVVTGTTGQLPILAGLPDMDLELVESHLYDGRIQHLSYVPMLL